ncbi:HAD family phosphatase [Rubellicoccus peritrichatus]|uniref:HAD family phosphatase n=1 Tax=Rubellicoccus peritrichatus TaxID=3080537 RepID=A0AAQ3L9Q5_9BACT|nr:HAD family phosphatase [Puniceicoccus sp. CR14]WOO41262.1 HAD family phosphatase [Puniceicoccus sp. CR14]
MSSNSFQAIQAVIFDMDGLLLDTERLFMAAYQQAANELGLDFPEELYQSMIGHRADSSQQILRDGIAVGEHADEIIDAARRYYYTAIETKGIPLRPGVEETIEYCEREGLPMAVATSTHKALALIKLKHVGLLDRFTAVVSGDEVEHGKPAPDIYLAAGKLLDIDITRCVVLEDSPPGLKAARAAGALAIFIPDLLPDSDDTRAIAKHVYYSLNDFLEAFKKGRVGVK